MAIMKIRIWPDEALIRVAEPVQSFAKETQDLVSSMFETMYAAQGIGLAATQVAVNQRVVVIDLNPDNDSTPEYREQLHEWGFEEPVTLINPEIEHASGSISWEEGCLSLPGINESIKRRGEVTVKAYNRHGEPFTLHAKGLFAVALQHEIDHLDGKLFVDYISRLKRDVIRRKMMKLKETYGNDGVAAAKDR